MTGTSKCAHSRPLTAIPLKAEKHVVLTEEEELLSVVQSGSPVRVHGADRLFRNGGNRLHGRQHCSAFISMGSGAREVMGNGYVADSKPCWILISCHCHENAVGVWSRLEYMTGSFFCLLICPRLFGSWRVRKTALPPAPLHDGYADYTAEIAAAARFRREQGPCRHL